MNKTQIYFGGTSLAVILTSGLWAFAYSGLLDFLMFNIAYLIPVIFVLWWEEKSNE